MNVVQKFFPVAFVIIYSCVLIKLEIYHFSDESEICLHCASRSVNVMAITSHGHQVKNMLFFT